MKNLVIQSKMLSTVLCFILLQLLLGDARWQMQAACLPSSSSEKGCTFGSACESLCLERKMLCSLAANTSLQLLLCLLCFRDCEKCCSNNDVSSSGDNDVISFDNRIID